MVPHVRSLWAVIVHDRPETLRENIGSSYLRGDAPTADEGGLAVRFFPYGVGWILLVAHLTPGTEKPPTCDLDVTPILIWPGACHHIITMTVSLENNRAATATGGLKFLMVGDESRNRRLLKFGLCGPEDAYGSVSTLGEIEQHVARRTFHVALLDWEMQAHTADEILKHLSKSLPELPVVVATSDAGRTEEIMSLGAAHVTIKPLDVDRLKAELRRFAFGETVSSTAGAANRPSVTPAGASLTERAPIFLSRHPEMQRTLSRAEHIAVGGAAVVIVGEPGTGKSTLAKTLHAFASSQTPLVRINCANPVEQSIDLASARINELEPDAVSGTFFFDGAAQWTSSTFTHFFAQFSEQSKWGIIATANAALEDSVLDVLTASNGKNNLEILHLLPLRERRDDIPRLIDYFITQVCNDLAKPRVNLTEAVAARLASYPWPGNLREINAAIERAVVLSSRDTLEESDFQFLTNDAPSTLLPGQFVSLKELEDLHIQLVIDRAPTLEHASKVLGIDKSTLYRKRRRNEGKWAAATPPEDSGPGLSSTSTQAF